MNWKLSQDGNSASRTHDDGSYESRLIIAIPEDELANALLADLPHPNELILARIAQLEATITNRRIREAALTIEGKDWLLAIDAQIAVLRGELNA